jgi:glucose/arabinose dehydrogenase
MRLGLLAGCLLGLLFGSVPHANAVGLQPVGTFNSPIYMTSPAGDPRLFVVERGGTIQVLHDGTRSQFLDISALTTTDVERGLESMAFDPNYASNGLFYVFYTGDGVDAGGALGDIHVDEFQVSSDPNVANPASRRTVWTFSHSAGNHNGGQLQFGPDGLLYITVGDNASGANAQATSNPYGKIFRLDPHGAGPGVHGVPSTNPFFGVGGAVQEIWGLGLRNPFRFSFDRATGDLVIADVGAGTREEIDFSPRSAGGGRGANYGWPCREGFIAGPGGCAGSFTDPVLDYPHASPGGGLPSACAIIGGFVYRGSQIPELAGRYLYTDLCTGQLRSAQLGLPLATGDRAEGPLVDGPQSFGQDASCELYVTNGNAVDKIVGSGSSSVTPACQGTAPTSAKSCKRHKKRRKRATSAKKRKKLCVRGVWAPRL